MLVWVGLNFVVVFKKLVYWDILGFWSWYKLGMGKEFGFVVEKGMF